METLEYLGLSVRTYNCLMRAGISTIPMLCNKSEKDLRLVRNLGEKGIAEIRQALSEGDMKLAGDE